MTEVESPVLEPLKRFQAQLSRLEEKLNEVAADMRGMKQHGVAFVTLEVKRDAAIAALQHRLDRVDRRLDLID